MHLSTVWHPLCLSRESEASIYPKKYHNAINILGLDFINSLSHLWQWSLIPIKVMAGNRELKDAGGIEVQEAQRVSGAEGNPTEMLKHHKLEITGESLLCLQNQRARGKQSYLNLERVPITELRAVQHGLLFPGPGTQPLPPAAIKEEAHRIYTQNLIILLCTWHPAGPPTAWVLSEAGV